MKHIIFLRGINVSGTNIIKMAKLKDVLNEAGFNMVQTYIQSGNIVVESDETPDEVELLVESSIRNSFGLDVVALATNKGYLQNILKTSPYKPDEQIDPKRLFYCFLKDEPTVDDLEKLKAVDLTNEYFTVNGRMVYIYVPGGIGKAKLNNNFIENKLKVKATTRNLNTLNKMIELAG